MRPRTRWAGVIPLLVLLLIGPIGLPGAQVGAAQSDMATGGGGTIGGDRRARINGPVGKRTGPTTPPPPPLSP